MIPAARISAAIEILSDVETRRRPTADAMKDWGGAPLPGRNVVVLAEPRRVVVVPAQYFGDRAGALLGDPPGQLYIGQIR
jgi:hypothetical protein